MMLEATAISVFFRTNPNYTVVHKNCAIFISTIRLANVAQWKCDSERIIKIGPHLPKLM